MQRVQRRVVRTGTIGYYDVPTRYVEDLLIGSYRSLESQGLEVVVQYMARSYQALG